VGTRTLGLQETPRETDTVRPMQNGNAFESTGVDRPRDSGEPVLGAMRAIIRDLDADVARQGDPDHGRASLVVAARSICAAARIDGLHIEQALVRVKEAWRSTPGRPKPRPGGTDAILDQLVSACIREFYTER